jgi:type IV fimbrial biogenesis protein FimT
VVIMSTHTFKPSKQREPRPTRRRAGGFTLIELVVACVVLAVLAVMAAPSITEMNARQRVQTDASDLFTSLLRARSEAIRQNTDVTLVPAGAWNSGWRITVGGTPIDAHGATTRVAIAGNVAAVTYRSSGRVAGATSPSFTLTATDTTVKRCVQVRLSGEPVVTSAACS